MNPPRSLIIQDKKHHTTLPPNYNILILQSRPSIALIIQSFKPITQTNDTVTIRFSPLPATPALRQPRFKISSSQRFEAVVRFLRKKLALKDHESVFCYVNSVFAPGLDEGVANLWRCFKVGEELVVSYSFGQAFG